MSLEHPRRSAKVEQDENKEAEMSKEAFVSGLYRPEEDTRNQPSVPLNEALIRTKKNLRGLHARRLYGEPRPPTEEERRLTNRMLGEKDE